MACGPMTAWRRHHAVKEDEGRTLSNKQKGKILENSIYDLHMIEAMCKLMKHGSGNKIKHGSGNKMLFGRKHL